MAERWDGKEKSYMREYGTYIDGNTVRKLEPVREPLVLPEEHEQSNEKEQQKTVRKKRKATRKATRRMDLFSTLFLSVMVIVTVVVSVKFLATQSKVTTMKNKINDLESQIVTMKEENKLAKDELTADVDLDYVYEYATKVLGMKHPGKKQVIKYQGKESDSVQQFGDIPGAN